MSIGVFLLLQSWYNSMSMSDINDASKPETITAIVIGAITALGLWLRNKPVQDASIDATKKSLDASKAIVDLAATQSVELHKEIQRMRTEREEDRAEIDMLRAEIDRLHDELNKVKGENKKPLSDADLI